MTARSAGARAIALLVAVVLAILVPGLSLPGGLSNGSTAEAAVRTAFGKVFQTDDNGAIAVIGNSQMTCPTSATGCTAAKSGSGSSLNNNNYSMVFIDNDGRSDTTNSTSADVNLPSGSTVLYARLIWGARVSSGGTTAAVGTIGTAKFRAPNASAYTSITATTLIRPGQATVDTDPYQASLDVTSTVQAAGNGTYWFADLPAGTGGDRYGGWSLVVAYRNPSLPLRNLTVFEGFADITASAGNSTVTATVSGLLTPSSGTVQATVGYVSWEGDLGSTGDYLKFENTTLADSRRSSTNFFNSSISNFGANITDRSPNDTNNFGVDFGRTSANGALANSATQATVTVGTSSETIYLGAVTTEIDLFTPSFVGTSKTVTNLSGNSPTKTGDVLQYTLSFTNSGSDPASNVVVRDPLPADVTYVPGSMTVVTGPNASTTPKTDDVGDDVADYVAADRLVRVRLGTGASSTSGGTVAVNASTSVTFRVTVERPAAGTTITNGSFLDYRAVTIGKDFTFVTNTVATPVQAIADLAVTKSANVASQTAGSQVTYTLGVTNNGPSTATSVVTTDTLPTGVAYVSSAPPNGTTCSASGQTVTCTTATLANAATLTIPITTTVGPGADAGTVVNTATVSASTSDDVSGNNTATASTTISRSADLGLAKTGPSTAVAGDTVTYLITATNGGPSSATATSVTDSLPVGTSVVSTTPSQGSCSTSGQTVTCALGTLAPAGTATIQIVARIAPAFTGSSIGDTATVSSTTPDPNAANNSASATTTVTRDADLAVTQTASAASVSAGNTVSYTITVANEGRSDALGVTLADTVPSGFSVVDVTPTQGTCTTAVSCQLGTITPGSSARVTILARVASTRDPATNVRNTATATTTTAEADTADNAASADVTVVTRANLSLTKTGSPAVVQLGTDLTYTLTARNAGPSEARTVVITDTLPNGTTFSGGQGCTASGQIVTCDLGILAAGDSTTRTVTVSTSPSATGTLSNTATVSSATTDPSTGDNTATVDSSTESLADLSLTNSAAPATGVPGQDITYTLTAANRGPSTARGVVVTDVLPSGLSYRSSSFGTNGSCTVSGQTVSCAVGTLAPSDSVPITLVARLASSYTATAITNTASVAAATPADPTTSNNTASARVSTVPSADVSVSLTPQTPTVAAGNEATYLLSVRNDGPSDAVNVQITGQVPDGMEPVLGSSAGACSVSGRTVTCPIASVPVGTTIPITFRARTLASLPAGPISGTAYVGSATPDQVAANNSSSATVTIVDRADLVAASDVIPDPLVAGTSALYTVRATNNGPSDATSVTLVDTLPEGVTVTAVTPSTGTCSLSGQPSSGQTVSCAADRLSPGGVLTVRISVDVAAADSGSLTNRVVVGSAVTDPDTTNNTLARSTTVVRSADLRLTKTVSPTRPVAGSSVQYVLTAVNAGPSVADAVVLEDTFPAEVTLLPGAVSAGAGVTCSTDLAARTISCALGTLVPGDSRTVAVDATVSPRLASGATLSNTARLTSPTPTQNPDGRTATATGTVGTSADVSVSQTAVAESPIAGAQEKYVITVANGGPSVARNVTVADPLPDGLSFVSIAGPGAVCTGGAEVDCALGDLDPGQVVVLRLVVKLDPRIAGRTVVQTTTVATTTDDPVSANNSTQLSQTVSAQNDLDVTKAVTSGPVVAGRPVTYSFTLTNNGPSRATGVTLTDLLPPGLDYTSAAAQNSGYCSYFPVALTPEDDDLARCVWNTVEVGDTVRATLTLAVPVDATDDVVNTVTAASSAADPTPASATVTSPVTTSADLGVTKSLLSGAPVPGSDVRWQISVRNAGPSRSRAVVVTDTAPAGVTFTGVVTSQGGTCAVAQSLSCALGDLTVGATATVTVTGRLSAAWTGQTLENTAAATAATTDPEPADNTASASSAIDAEADLSVTQQVSPATLTPGRTGTWTVTVRNDGPSDARSVVLTDPLPSGVALVSATLDGGAACTGTTTVRCTLGTVPSGTERVLTLVGRVAAGYAAGSLTHVVEVTSGTADPDGLDNQSSLSTPVSRVADLSLTATGPSAAVPGRTAAWTLTVANAGPSDTSGAVLTIALPAGLLDATGSFAGGTCSRSGSTLVCQLGAAPAGDSTAVTVQGRVDPAETADTAVLVASLGATTADPDTDDLSASVSTSLDPAADLSITTSAASSSFVAGERAVWNVTVRNDGPSVARTVRVVDAAPAGVADLQVSGAGCTVDAGQVVCETATLAPGATLSLTVSGLIDPAYAATNPTGTVDLSDTASVSSTTPDPDSADLTSTSTTPVGQRADVALGKALTSGVPVAGEAVSFSLVARNAGPSLATGLVVTDAVPDDIDAVSASTAAGSCQVSGNDVRCALDDLGAGGQAVITVAGVLDPAFEGALTNRASATADQDDPATANNTGTADLDADEQADIAVAVSGPATLVAGTRGTWTVDVVNRGPSLARSVSLTELLPAGLSGIEVDGPAGCRAIDDCVLDELAVDQTVTVTVTAVLAASYAGSNLTVEAQADADTSDPSSLDNVASAVSLVQSAADLSIAATVSPSRLTPGRGGTYTLTVTNDGPSTARRVVVEDALPVGLSATGGGAAADTGSCTTVGSQISCQLGSLGVGETVTITVPVALAADYADPTVVTTAVVSSSTTDPDDSDNTVVTTIGTDTVADLTLTGAIASSVEAGTPLGWTFTVVNDGPSDARGLVLTSAIPAGAGDAVVEPSQGSCEIVDSAVTCALGTVPAGGGATVSIRLAGGLPSDYPAGALTVEAGVSSPTPEPADGDAGNDGRSTSLSTDVVVSADVSAEKVADAATVQAGERATWTVTVSNAGPSTARDVVVTDAGGTGLRALTLTDPAAAGTAGVDCTAARCTVASLAPGASAAVRLQASAEVPADFSGDRVVNALALQAGTADPDPGDNTASAALTVTRSGGLSVAMTGPASVVPGERASWAVTVTNAGPSLARDVLLLDDLPAALSAITVDAPAGVTCTGDATLRCTLGDLVAGAGGTVTLTISGRLESGYAAATLDNTVAVSSTTPDPDTTDNTASTSADVTPVADLSLTADGPAAVVAGEPVVWTLTAANAGPSQARDVTVTVTLPAGVGEVVGGAAEGGVPCSLSGNVLTCTISALDAGDDVAIRVRGVVDPAFTGDGLDLGAVVASTASDPVPADNTTSVSSDATSSADLSVSESVDPSPVRAGEAATLTLLVANAGPSVAVGTTLTQVLPAGFTPRAATATAGGCTIDGRTVRCVVGDLPATGDDPVRVEIVVDVADDVDPDAYALTATVLSSTTDPDLADNSATVSGDTATEADLRLTKTADTTVAVPGEQVAWTLTARNDGPSTARAVTLTDLLPAAVRVTSATSTQGACDPLDAAPLVCSLGDLRDGQIVVVSVIGVLDEGATATVLTNSASLASGSTSDPDGDDAAAQVDLPVLGSADLAVTTAAAPDPVVAGTTITWTVTARNDGPSRARDLTLTHELPAGVSLVSRSFSGAGACADSTDAVTCAITALAPGTSAVLTVVGTLEAGYSAADVSSTATVTGDLADPDPSDNTATATVPVGRSADLALSADGPADRSAGQSAEWTFTLDNSGPSDATGALVRIAVPGDLRDVEVVVGSTACSVADGTATCAIGTLEAGDARTVTVRGLIDPASTADAISLVATASATTADPDDTDLTATASTALGTAAGLSLTKQATGGPFVAGENAGWVLTVVNGGPSVAREVVLSDAIPAGLLDADVAVGAGTLGAGAECAVVDSLLTCDVGDLAAGATLAVRLSGVLDPAYAGAGITNTASLSTATTDPESGDDTATSTTAVDTSADLSVGKAITSGPPVAGAPIAFAVEVSNNGPSTARSVLLTDAVPAQIGGVQAAVTGGAPGGSCTVEARDVSCDLGDLAPDATATIAVTGVLAQSFDDALTNTARAESDTADAVAGNDTGSADATVGDSADLVVSADGPAEVTAGSPASWTVTVRNDGPSDARGVVLTDLLPAGLTGVSVDGADCDTSVRCVLGSLASGASVTITVRASVDPDVAAAGLTLRASVSADTADPDSIDNSASTTSSLVRAADLQVSQEVAPTVLVPGSSATYTVTVRNDGPSSADDVVVVEDLPAGLILAGTPTVDGADCTVSGSRISCALARLGPGESVEVSIPVRVPTDLTAAVLATTVRASSTTPEQNPDDNTSTVETSVSAAADLTVTASAPTRATAGEQVSWRIAVRNDGPSDAQQVVLTDTLPAGLGEVLITSDGGTCSRTGDEVRCTYGVLAPGAEVVWTLTTVLPGNYPAGPMLNGAVVSSTTPEPGADPQRGRSDSTSTAVGVQADLVVSNVAQQQSAVAGESVSWLVRVVNDGPSTATSVELRDLAPAGVTGWTIQPPAGVTCSAGVCAISSLAPGADNALVFTVTGTLSAGYTAADVVSTATVTSPDAEDDATAESRVPVSTRAAVSLAMTGPDSVTPGTEVSWVLTLTNGGPSVARDLVLTDRLPDAVSGVRVVAPAGVTCTGIRTVVCSLDSLAVGAGEAVQITITATLDQDAGAADLDNTATVTSATPDQDLADNTASTSAAPAPVSDLRVSKSGPSEVIAGQDVRWRIRVANAGPSLARQVVLTDALPVGVVGVAVEAPDGTSCAVTAGTVRCESAALAVGDSVLVVVDGQVDPAAVTAALSNVATVTSDSTDPDPTSNSTDPVVTAVGRAADLSLTKTVDPDPVEAGSSAVFTLVARNDGPSTARSSTVTDVLPDAFAITGVGLSGSDGRCRTEGQRVTCDLGDLAPDATASVVIAAAVSDDLDPDTFANTASVTSADPDPEVSDNSATAAGDTATRADLSVTNTADRAGVSAGRPISWTVVVRNDGPSTARGVTLRDVLPAGVTVSGVTTSAGSCAPVTGDVLSCDLGSLRDGEEITVSITGTVDADTEAAELTATAAVAATGTADPDNSDDVAVSVTPVTGSAGVSLTMTTDPSDTVVAGTTLTWTLTASNAGPSLARGVVLTDVLPDGVELVRVPDGCELTGRTLRCTIGSIAVGASVTVALEVRVDPAAVGSLTNTAEVSAASGDPDLADNTATAAVPVRTVADVSVTKRVDQTSVRLGQAVTYRVDVANAGPSAAREVELLEQWPDGVRFESASVDAGTFDAATMLWTIGTLAPGQTVELVIVGTATRVGLGSNSVEVTQTGGLDPAVSNGVAAAELSVREDGGLPDTGGPALGILVAGLAALVGGGLLLIRTRRRTS